MEDRFRMPSHFDKGLVSQVPAIRAIGRARLADAGVLEDFVQETLLRAYTRRDQLADAERLPQWVHAIARNTASNWNRDRRYLPILSDAIADSADGADKPCARMEAEERFRALRSALMTLSSRDREMLVAHVVDGVAYRDLRARYGLSSSAVGVRLHRAKRRVRERLGTMLGAAACGVGLGARQAIGMIMMTARWKAAVLVGAAVGGTVAIGVWQVARPVSPAPDADGRAKVAPTTRAAVPRRGRIATPPVTADQQTRPTPAPSIDWQAARRPAPKAATASSTVTQAPPEPASVTGQSAVTAGRGAEEPLPADIASGAWEGIPESGTIVGAVELVVGGEMQIRLADGTQAVIVTPDGAPFPEGTEGAAVSFEIAPSDER
jgi:RNA polymerase sigma factor (sigma-70 family)